MLVPPEVSSSCMSSSMIPGSSSSLSSSNESKAAHLLFQVNKFVGERVQLRRQTIHKNMREVVKITQDILKEVEVQEPRFVSSLNQSESIMASSSSHSGSYHDGLRVISSTEFEVSLFLNQMGVFNFVDDGSLPGCSVLKLSDGRKRSMSLWVEFITASGYLSARKIRSRFQTLVAQAVDKSVYRDIVKVMPETSEVKLRIRDRFVVQVTPGMFLKIYWSL